MPTGSPSVSAHVPLGRRAALHRVEAIIGWAAVVAMSAIALAELLGTSRFALMVFAQAILPIVVVAGGLLSAALAGPIFIVGDFNATLAHPPLRILQRRGYREVHSWLGHGLRPSWPMGAWPLPPLMRIDHAFVRGGVAPLSVRDFALTDSDHRGFVVDFLVRGL